MKNISFRHRRVTPCQHINGCAIFVGGLCGCLLSQSPPHKVFQNYLALQRSDSAKTSIPCPRRVSRLNTFQVLIMLNVGTRRIIKMYIVSLLQKYTPPSPRFKRVRTCNVIYTGDSSGTEKEIIIQRKPQCGKEQVKTGIIFE